MLTIYDIQKDFRIEFEMLITFPNTKCYNKRNISELFFFFFKFYLRGITLNHQIISENERKCNSKKRMGICLTTKSFLMK